MSVAGFDLVIEIARSALLDLLKSNMAITGELANPPFEITIPLTVGGLDNGVVHVIVDDLLLDLRTDDTATLTFLFSNSSVLTSSPGPTITALDGEFSVNAPLGLSVSAQSQLTIPAINLGAANVTVDFTTDAVSKLTAGLAGTGVSVAQFTTFSATAVQTFIQAIGSEPLGNGYNVLAGSNGALSPLRFERLELHCIVGGPTNQAVGLFGILLAANSGNGDASLKTTPAITSGHDVCVNISPGVFHTLVFCPNVADKLGFPVSLLPPTCGSNPAGVPTNGAQLTSLKDSFGSDKIDIHGSAYKSGFCYDATAKFHGELTMSASGTTLTPSVKYDDPDVDVSIDFWCGPAGGVAIGLTALINVAITNAIAEAVAVDIASGAMDSVLGKSLPTENVGIDDVNFDQVTIASDRMMINGHTSIQVPPKRAPALTLLGSVTTSSKNSLSTGKYTASAPLCPPKEFPYTEYAQQQVASYQAIPTLLGLPLKLEWWILAGNGVTKVNIPQPSGGISFAAQTLYAMPLPAGTYTNQVVHITCSTSDALLQMTNVAAEGNYQFGLYAKAVDPLGNVVQILTPGFPVLFEGNVVEIGGGYQEYLAECWGKFYKLNAKFSEWVNVKFTPWVPVNYPSPEELLNHFITLAVSDHPRGPTALLESLVAHGSSTYRALLSNAAKQVGQAKSKKGIAG